MRDPRLYICKTLQTTNEIKSLLLLHSLDTARELHVLRCMTDCTRQWSLSGSRRSISRRMTVDQRH